MAEFPALPLWTDAYLADCGHLNDAEHGRYLLILMHLWRSPQQRFPNDNAWLSRKFGRSLQAFENEVLPLMREFMHTDGNWWMQKRLSAEWEYVRKTTSRQSDAAKARWNKHKRNSHGNAERHASGNAPTPTPTPLERDKESLSLSVKEFDFDAWFDHELWLHFPRRVGKGAARKAAKGAIAKTSPETILSGVKRHAALMAGKDEQYIPHPATWLNQERWLDQPATNGHDISEQDGPRTPPPRYEGGRRVA